ncbi:MAG: cation transporter, partial [Burkholderiales bacterium]|nr:cation transporter [Burkholderiales bacterium]
MNSNDPIVAPGAKPAETCDECHGNSSAVPAFEEARPPPGQARFRVPTLDCPSEESEIRRAVEHIAGIRALTFQLGQRSMTIDALPEVIEQAVAAIRKAGFDPQTMPDKGTSKRDADTVGSDDHDHGAGAVGGWRLGGALLLAIGAEMLGFFAPDTQAWTAAGLALSAVAIWLAGFDVYKKGLTALRHGRLNINALMTVAVTGAFAIGQWPEAAMVMAL